ncbi:MAG: glycoside hydrolase family 13 protein [Sediminispirochaetaceae bacterium]
MKKTWWKEGVVYQIYPRSFYDSNGDGIGDLQGIVRKLDYIAGLGIDIVWLNPVYASPNADNGYDISDYYDIMDEFGSMEDWEELLAGLHSRGIRLIMDLVVNHTSDEHAWFIESRSSRNNPYRDYYIWRPPLQASQAPGTSDQPPRENSRTPGSQAGSQHGSQAGDQPVKQPDSQSGELEPPNNWRSLFSGPAWEYDPATGEYYLHLFDKKQPDLNWENPRMREDIYAMMRWWLDKGIDGFRMDVINFISKVPGLPSVGPDEAGSDRSGMQYYMNGPRIHEFLQELQSKALKGYNAMTVGETFGVGPELARQYTCGDPPEMSMLFHFELMTVDRKTSDRFRYTPWELKEMKEIIEKWQHTLHGCGWNSNFLMNHDQPRAVSRFADDGKYRRESAKLLATLTLTLEGTPYIYQGEEIGMTNPLFQSIDEYRDVELLNHYREQRAGGAGTDELLQGYHRFARDNARTPMQWDGSPHAGFTDGTPWMNVNPDYREINVRAELAREDSIHGYIRDLIKLRKNNDTLIYGGFALLDRENPRSFCYLRRREKEAPSEGTFLIALNFSSEETALPVAEPGIRTGEDWKLELCNYPDREKSDIHRPLRPWEARIYRSI